ncbi:hypothetical protein HFN20_24045 [Paenibacillus dendritiformis]|uniref:CDP-glycerol glycerophosphotransferase family protein n=1 Tax=Paenibacillus dendritiformis TaxID=130049 RepID=UPI00143D5673|nr:CDP-glycerol glycerophosphotransferase family protein [Paenibacillus dendritiformis]NKI24245.1 hypothetical protein [Paenibacillus dendritiformis]
MFFQKLKNLKNHVINLLASDRDKNTYNGYVFHSTIENFQLLDSAFHIKISVELISKKNFEVLCVVAKYRGMKKIEYEFDVNVKVNQKKGNVKRITSKIFLEDIDWEPIFWDLFIKVVVDSTVIYVRINNPKFRVNTNISKKEKYLYPLNEGKIIYPYFGSNKSLSFTIRKFDKYETKYYKLKEKLSIVLYSLMKFYFNRKKIWLIYEKFAETAQDNAYFFFKYCIENEVPRNVYYVVKKESNDICNLNGLEGNVVYFMSLRHLILLQACKIIISSEAKGHGYIWRANRGKIFKILNKKNQVFLQHGVLGFKKIGDIFNNSSNSPNRVKLFVASSDFERDIIKQYFGYEEEKIVISGLARWDYLMDKSKGRSEILLMPTFRNWLEEVSESTFEHSTYFKEYSSLLKSDILSDFLLKSGTRLNFYLHPKLSNFIDMFSINNPNINIVRPGDKKINELIMQSSLLITDYSSVAWDMFYLKKPIVFFQFDYIEYMKRQGSYIDMTQELIGERVTDIPQLLNALEYYFASNFNEKLEHCILRKKYIEHIDNDNCYRLYKSILDNEKELTKNSLMVSIKQNEFIYEIWRLLKTILKNRG